MNRRMMILIIFSLALHLAVLGALTVSMKTQDFELGSSSRTEILALETGSSNSPTSHKQTSPPAHNLHENHNTQTAPDSTSKSNAKDLSLSSSNTNTVSTAASAGNPKSTENGSPGPVAIGSADPYYSEVRARIQSHATYTQALARRRLQGQVQVILTLLSNGSISSLYIAKSSGSADLDRRALESVQASAPFPTFQSPTSARKLELPIDFRLH